MEFKEGGGGGGGGLCLSGERMVLHGGGGEDHRAQTGRRTRVMRRDATRRDAT